MNISKRIRNIQPDESLAELTFISCQNPGQVYVAGFDHARSVSWKIAESAEEYIKQLEGIAYSVMPESMVRAIAKECGYE